MDKELESLAGINKESVRLTFNYRMIAFKYIVK